MADRYVTVSIPAYSVDGVEQEYTVKIDTDISTGQMEQVENQVIRREGTNLIVAVEKWRKELAKQVIVEPEEFRRPEKLKMLPHRSIRVLYEAIGEAYPIEQFLESTLGKGPDSESP